MKTAIGTGLTSEPLLRSAKVALVAPTSAIRAATIAATVGDAAKPASQPTPTPHTRNESATITSDGLSSE